MARKILLADDSVTAQNMGRKILADAGYEVITVNNGSAALKKISEQKPDLIVLDVYMPGYSGLEVCQRVKEVGETSRIPILLTVGKLEPFKPEEAKRVRADGFIVKPFEASELLSALSKLEDKVVPRAESTKQGRFARATAAIEEGRYDKTMAVDDEDSGWKNRIAFPKKKKEKPVQEDVDDPAMYNPVNKDLRTVIDHKAAEPAPAVVPHAEEQHVDLGALAPEGLPKDVTPEEIAALAAAAAQIKGKVTDEKPVALAEEMAVTPPPAEVQAPKPEIVEAAKPESKDEIRPAEPAPAPEVIAPEPPATFAEQEKTEEKIEETKTKPAVASTQADMMTAIMGLETQVFAVHTPISGPDVEAKPTPEPVTMAMAAVADAGASSRWTAVAVALAPEEAAVSLEQEMQKAYAAFAAAEGVQAAAAPSISEAKPAVAETVAAPAETTSAPTETTAATITSVAPSIAMDPEATQEIVLPSMPPIDPDATQALAIPLPAPIPEAVPPFAAMTEEATEAINAAVKELEAVAAAYEAEKSAPPTEPASTESASPIASESAATPVLETPQNLKEELKVAEAPAKEAELPAQEVAAAPAVETAAPPVEAQVEASDKEENQAPVIEAPEAVAKVEVPEESKAELPAEESSSEKVSMEPVPVSKASTAGGTDDMAKKESEAAAAWASWRKIRETGSKPGQPSEASKESEEASVPEDRAAMAVAVGAESNPEAVAHESESEEIASIVDSVLADLRPKIVEEISRKLGKKK